MGLAKLFGYTKIAAEKKQEVTQDVQPPDTKSNYGGGGGQGVWWPVVNKRWDGEKTLGELGVVVRNLPDYYRLRLRSYDAYVKTDTIKIITSKHCDYVVGSGLKLQAEPNEVILKSVISPEALVEFKKMVEARWSVYTSSIYCDYSRQLTFHQLAYEYYKAKYLGGDCLVVCRIEKEGPNIQFISGEFIQTPFLNEDGLLAAVKARENYIEDGIEFNSRGEHVAYFVNVQSPDSLYGKFERIPAKGKLSGRKLAWMIYGEKISPDHKRGVPKTAQVLEKANKLDRYTEAAVSKAEQAANLVYTIKHQDYSTGENPMTELMKQKLKVSGSEIDGYAIGESLANKVAQTTSNMTVNLPPGAEFDSFNTDIETNYPEFESANFNKISAASNIPPEVALQVFNSNYSASRAATNGWGYVVDIDRKDYETQFYKPFFTIWLEIEILKNNIEAPGFILALSSGDFMIIEAYTQCRFIGKNQPHVDPLKEVKAARAILGDNDKTPLGSREQMAEMLNLGDWNENYKKSLEEDKKIIIKPVENGTIPASVNQQQ